MTARLRLALGLEVVFLAAPIAATFGFMTYRGTHPRNCDGGGCGDFSSVFFLLSVAVFGPTLWVVARLMWRGLAPNRADLAWLVVASVYLVAAVIVLPLLATWIAILLPAVPLLSAVIIAVTTIGLAIAIVEPRPVRVNDS